MPLRGLPPLRIPSYEELCVVECLHPIRLKPSLHETIWGGRRLERDGWKLLPPGDVAIGESWETELSTVAQNEPYTGKTLGTLVEEAGIALLGEQTVQIFGYRFPLLAKFIDANAKLSVQVHPDDTYAAEHEGGKLGKTEFWYVLAAEPGATIVHGFKGRTSRAEVQKAIQEVTLENLLHEEIVSAGDVIFVPAGTVHAIGSGAMLYELQEYSDITYRMYDYGRLTAAGTLRPLHIEQSLDVAHYDVSSRIKMKPVLIATRPGYEDRCLAACKYFVTRELLFKSSDGHSELHPYFRGKTEGSCIVLTSPGAEGQVRSGKSLECSEPFSRGQTMILPAALGDYAVEGIGSVFLSYVPAPGDEAWETWEKENG